MAKSEQKLENIIDSLRQKIKSGEYGQYKLPPKTDLAVQFTTTRDTISRAIQQLQAEGLILYSKGSRLAINMPKTRIPGVVESFDTYLKSQGLEPKIENLEEPARTQLPAGLAVAFGLTEGVEVVRRLRRQGTTTTPYRLAETYYLWELLDDDIYHQLRENPYFVCIDAIYRKHGKFIELVHEDVFTRFPTAQEQELLNVVRHTPVLEVHRTNRSADGTLIMANRIVLVGSFFILSYDYGTERWKNKFVKEQSGV